MLILGANGGMVVSAKKRHLYFLAVIALLFTARASAQGWRTRVWPTTPDNVEYPTQLTGWLIVIDPGHGGSDSGAVNKNLNLKEKDIVLAVGLKLRTALQDLGARVEMTRDTDKSMLISERYTLANNLHAHRLVSLHNNAANTTAEGIETWVDSDAPQVWKNYASSLHRNTISAAKAYDSSIRDRGIKYSGTTPPWSGKKIGVINYANIKCPAALLELNFIDNDKEANRLIRDDYQRALANGMANGFLEHASQYNKEDGLKY